MVGHGLVHLGANRYGKAEVRIARGAAPRGGDLIRDWNVSTRWLCDLTADDGKERVCFIPTATGDSPFAVDPD